MTRFVRGRLPLPTDAPAAGERSEEIVRVGGVVVEHILSGTLPSPVDYQQPYDEWVVVLAGGAILEVGAERFDLAAGYWVLLPAHVPHRLVETRQGTTWLTLHSLA